MTQPIHAYHDHITGQLAAIVEQEGDNIQKAAEAVAAAVRADRDFLTFGSGHSELIAREAVWRAGGLAPALAIIDPTGGDLERMEGAAQLILGHYALRPGSVIIVISNSGINPVPVEVAQVAKDAGLTVVALTAMQHSRDVPPRHSSGKKLYEIADIVIDTHTPRGDTAYTLPNSGFKTAATSTVAGAFIMEAITAGAAQIIDAAGEVPPVLVSANVPEGDAHNRALKQKYLPRLVRYEIDTAELPDAEK
jgi:uncharacterized phosphosugar-binding protein